MTDMLNLGHHSPWLSSIVACLGSARLMWQFAGDGRSIRVCPTGGCTHGPRHELGYFHDGPCDHQPDRYRLRHYRHVCDARLPSGLGPDRDLSVVDGPDQRHRLSVSIHSIAAVAHDWAYLAGAARDRLHRALRDATSRSVALDLCGDGAGLALSQRVRAGNPELPQDTGAA